MKHIMMTTNTGWSMMRHRREQIRSLVGHGWRVTAVAAYSEDEAAAVRELGAKTIRVSCQGSSMHPVENLRYMVALMNVMRHLKPDIVHNFSLKACIWGTAAARLTSVPRIVCTITGAGSRGSVRSSSARALFRGLYRVVFSSNVRVIFQNPDDLNYFVENNLVKREQAKHIPGCGVDIGGLRPNFERNGSKRFVMVSRMLWSKGVKEFVEAAETVKRKCPDTEFLLVGGSSEDHASKNPDFVPAEWLNQVTSDGYAKWIGRVPPERAEQIMREATAVVLLSRYGEGVPRALIEAAALGAPIITTDTPGCRDVVENNVSGFLCNGAGPQQVADAMMRLIKNPQLVTDMGRAGRALSQKFDKDRVIDETLRVYGKVKLLA